MKRSLFGVAVILASLLILTGCSEEIEEGDSFTGLDVNQSYPGQELTFRTYTFTPPTTGSYTIEASNVQLPSSTASLRINLYDDRSAAESDDTSQALEGGFGTTTLTLTVTLTGGQQYYLTALAVLTTDPIIFDLEITG